MQAVLESIRSGYTLMYIVTWEEDRVERALNSIAQNMFAHRDCTVWTAADGLKAEGVDAAATRDPCRALEQVMNLDQKGFYIFKDIADHFDRNPALVRRLRDAYYALKDKDKYIIILSPRFSVPEILKREIYLMEFDLPDEEEIYEHIKPAMSRLMPDRTISDDTLKELSLALKGFTLSEVSHSLNKIFAPETVMDEAMERIFREKEQIVRKEGVLEFVPPRFHIAEIGGLDVLKEWLIKREQLFTAKAREYDVPLPRGILLMGVSGCGKSLAVKAISSLWKLPLFRLDMNLVFSGAVDSPESLFHKALKQMEAMAPAVLWIDEIEMGVAGYREGESISSAHIFAHFLTWMQEKNANVFVAATANRIHLLPAEIIRKGRFDQIFFIDLPNDEERKQIFAIHLKKNGVDPALFDMVLLSVATKGWNGSEIEQAVAAARVDAFYQNRHMSAGDITRNISKIVPLSKTMEAQIKQIKGWAFDRALPASSKSTKLTVKPDSGS